MMVWTLALRHLVVRPGRAVVLFGGYAIGVAVMIVLLSVGDAMLDQSRDASLISGGELTALPQGVDIEAMRTGGLTGMFFGINGARFVTRQLIGGARHQSFVAAASPVLEQKLLQLRHGDSTWAVRAGGELPDAAMRAGAGLRLVTGEWRDGPVDRAWNMPTRQEFYDEIDRFHLPARRDSSWAEWHYFNIVASEREWWYVTLLVGGNVGGTVAGGQVLVTHRSPDGAYQRFTMPASGNAVIVDTSRADLVVGSSSVTQRDGVYHVHGVAGTATVDFNLTPAPAFHFPPVELGDDHDASGYVVPALVATATGRFCVAGACRELREVSAYHDHNWGSWRAVTWEWGSGRGIRHALLYGGVISQGSGGTAPFFLALEDSLGVRQLYRFDSVEHLGSRDVPGMPGIVAPESLRINASRLGDSLRIDVRVVDVAASRSPVAGPGRVFLQMRGQWKATGTAAGVAVADSGTGFFETWVNRRKT